MPATRYLRPRTTAPIDDATLAAAVAAVIGPPGLVRYPPRSPALVPPSRPRGRTIRYAGLPLALGALALAELLGTLWLGGAHPAGGIGTLPPATVLAIATARPSAPATVIESRWSRTNQLKQELVYMCLLRIAETERFRRAAIRQGGLPSMPASRLAF